MNKRFQDDFLKEIKTLTNKQVAFNNLTPEEQEKLRKEKEEERKLEKDILNKIVKDATGYDPSLY